MCNNLLLKSIIDNLVDGEVEDVVEIGQGHSRSRGRRQTVVSSRAQTLHKNLVALLPVQDHKERGGGRVRRPRVSPTTELVTVHTHDIVLAGLDSSTKHDMQGQGR